MRTSPCSPGLGALSDSKDLLFREHSTSFSVIPIVVFERTTRIVSSIVAIAASPERGVEGTTTIPLGVSSPIASTLRTTIPIPITVAAVPVLLVLGILMLLASLGLVFRGSVVGLATDLTTLALLV